MSNIDTLKLLGSLLGSGAVSNGSGATILQSVLGAAMGGGQSQQGGLGNILGAVLGGTQQAQPQQAQGGLGNILGAVLGGGQQTQANQGGALAGLLGSSGLGGLLGAAMGQYSQSQKAGAAPTSAHSCDHLPQGVSHAQATDQATLLLRAMINAAKSDGRLDKKEEQAILGKLGDISQEEIAFIKQELATPLDVSAFANSIPRGLEQQVYAISLMAIDLDSQAEAQYLDKLAQGIGISHEMSNQIHTQMGAPVLYS